MTTTTEPLIWEPGEPLDRDNGLLWDAAYYRILVIHHEATRAVLNAVGSVIREYVTPSLWELYEPHFEREMIEWLIVSASSELNGEPWDTSIDPDTEFETVIAFNPATGFHKDGLEVFVNGQPRLIQRPDADSRWELRILAGLSEYINAPRVRIPFTSWGIDHEARRLRESNPRLGVRMAS